MMGRTPKHLNLSNTAKVVLGNLFRFGTEFRIEAGCRLSEEAARGLDELVNAGMAFRDVTADGVVIYRVGPREHRMARGVSAGFIRENWFPLTETGT